MCDAKAIKQSSLWYIAHSTKKALQYLIGIEKKIKEIAHQQANYIH